jgi:hypothetical protein
VCAVAASVLSLGYAGASSGAASCPPREPHLLVPTSKGPRLLVRPSAASVLLCRYRGLNPQATALRLRSSRLISERAELAPIVTALNGLPTATSGFHRPMDDGSAILLRFFYAHAAVTAVRVGLTGCRTVTGPYLPLRTAVSPAGARLISKLERLLP